MLRFRNRLKPQNHPQNTPANKPQTAAAIDIDDLDENELLKLATRIVDRIKDLAVERGGEIMRDLKIGDRVAFATPRKGTVEGAVVRFNKKTVSIKADDGQRWSVMPILLRKVG